MSVSSAVQVVVPATTANLGPGFDCLGAALERYNTFQVRLTPHAPAGTVTIDAIGSEADRVSTKPDNLFYKSFVHLFEQLGQPFPAVHITIDLGVPLARGLGSSATAIVGGVVAANALAGSPLQPEAVLGLAIALEGHPDNVVPAFLGGCQLTCASPQQEKPWQITDIPWHPDIVPVVAIPDFELSTSAARQVLPQQYDRPDVIFTMAHLGLLLRALDTGRVDWLAAALDDRIHQPYRQPLIPGFSPVQRAALAAGAHGLVISGAGPTLLALTDTTHQAAVTTSIRDTWSALGIAVDVSPLPLDRLGVQVTYLTP